MGSSVQDKVATLLGKPASQRLAEGLHRPAVRESDDKKMSDQQLVALNRFAEKYSEYCASGRRGTAPSAPSGIDSTAIDYVRRIAGDAQKARDAQRKGDAASVKLHRETVPKLRGIMKGYGIDADRIYSVAYMAG